MLQAALLFKIVKNMLVMRHYILSHSEIQSAFYTYSTRQFQPAISQVLRNHMGLETVVSEQFQSRGQQACFCKRSGCKYLRLRRPYRLCLGHSALWSQCESSQRQDSASVMWSRRGLCVAHRMWFADPCSRAQRRNICRPVLLVRGNTDTET